MFEQEALTGGPAFHAMLSDVNMESQLEGLKKEVEVTKSPSKRDILIKQIKYLDGLKRMGKKPEQAYILNHLPVIPPLARPTIQMPGNRIEYADVNHLYKEHMTVNAPMKDLLEFTPNESLIGERTALYDGAKAIVGLGDALTGSSRGKNLKGFLKQIAGESGPKTGFFQSKILSKKQDFSARATIYAEPNLGFNEMAVPEEMLWTLYEFHIIRDLVKNGYDYPSAKKAVEERTMPAKASFSKLVKHIPIIANRAPTLMQSNITAHFPVPVKGKTLGVNPLHLKLYAGDFDGDAMTIHVPITPEAVEEAKKKLLPESHIYDFRRGLGNSLIAPGHEAILGSIHMTEPDSSQKHREFASEEEALSALKTGEIQVNTPIKIRA